MALDGADALVLMTAHREFRELDLRRGRVKERMRTPIIIDGRRVFEQSEVRGLGFVYRGVGGGHLVKGITFTACFYSPARQTNPMQSPDTQ